MAISPRPGRSTTEAEYGWVCLDALCGRSDLPVDPDDPFGVAVRAARRHARELDHNVALVKVAMLVWPDR